MTCMVEQQGLVMAPCLKEPDPAKDVELRGHDGRGTPNKISLCLLARPPLQ